MRANQVFFEFNAFFISSISALEQAFSWKTALVGLGFEAEAQPSKHVVMLFVSANVSFHKQQSNFVCKDSTFSSTMVELQSLDRMQSMYLAFWFATPSSKAF